MSRELLPCPFCGGDAKVAKHPGSWGYYPPTVRCGCTKCPTQTAAQWVADSDHSTDPKESDAIEMVAAKWNTRAPVSVTNDPRVVALIEAAQSALELGFNDTSARELRAALANLEKKDG